MLKAFVEATSNKSAIATFIVECMNSTALGWEIITLIILEESAICCNEKQRRVYCESMGFNHVTFYLIEYEGSC